jgi:hypothetical protein
VSLQPFSVKRGTNACYRLNGCSPLFVPVRDKCCAEVVLGIGVQFGRLISNEVLVQVAYFFLGVDENSAGPISESLEHNSPH